MAAKNILSGNIEDLKTLRQIVGEQMENANAIVAMDIEKQKLEKEAQLEEKIMYENIEFTIKKRRDQIVSNFDNQIGKVQDKQKKVRAERGKEKNKKVASRIKEETKDLVQENENIKEEYRTYMRQKGLSRFWDNKWFMSVFFPRTISEMGILFATFFMAIFGMPYIICMCMGKTFWLLKLLVVLVYLAVVVVLYAFIYRFARDDYKADFKEVRTKQAVIMKNKAAINKIKKRIKTDKDEAGYDLHKYDKEIDELQETIDDIVSRKNAALEDFDKTTKQDIYDEIYKRDIVGINNKKERIVELSESIKESEAHQKERAIYISTNYSAYLGEENLAIDRIERLIGIMENETVQTVGDAINILNSPQPM